jgi:hypothetical protein
MRFTVQITAESGEGEPKIVEVSRLERESLQPDTLGLFAGRSTSDFGQAGADPRRAAPRNEGGSRKEGRVASALPRSPTAPEIWAAILAA